MTVRNNMNKVVQFTYGDDSIDTVKVENQNIPITRMTIDEIYAHYNMPSDDLKDAVYTTSYTKYALRRISKQKGELNENVSFTSSMLDARDKMIKNIFKYQDNTKVHIPVSFQHIIDNIRNQMNITHMSMVDITPLEIFQLIEKLLKKWICSIIQNPLNSLK